MKFLLVFFATLSLLWSCSCPIPPETPEALKKADAVFVGRVETLNETDSAKEAVFTVDKTFKGGDGDSVRVMTEKYGLSCGVDFMPGHSFIVYAYLRQDSVVEPISDEKLWTNSCTRTRLLTYAQDDMEILEGMQKPESGVFDKFSCRIHNWEARGYELHVSGSGQFRLRDLERGILEKKTSGTLSPEELSALQEAIKKIDFEPSSEYSGQRKTTRSWRMVSLQWQTQDRAVITKFHDEDDTVPDVVLNLYKSCLNLSREKIMK
jgi:hypothetical protein